MENIVLTACQQRSKPSFQAFGYLRFSQLLDCYSLVLNLPSLILFDVSAGFSFVGIAAPMAWELIFQG